MMSKTKRADLLNSLNHLAANIAVLTDILAKVADVRDEMDACWEHNIQHARDHMACDR